MSDQTSENPSENAAGSGVASRDLFDDLREMARRLRQTAVETSTEDATNLRRYADAIDRYIAYTESLRSAASIVLRKANDLGGVPGLLAEMMLLHDACKGKMTVISSNVRHEPRGEQAPN